MRLFVQILIVSTLVLAFGGTALAQSSDHVVLVIIDGARYTETLGDPAGTWTPRMKQLAAVGTVIDTFVNDNVTSTARAVPAIWTGSWAAPIDTTIPPQAKNQYCATPTVWEYFRKHRGVDSTQAIYFTKYLTTPWMPSFSAGYGPPVWPLYLSAGARDRDVWNNCRTVMGVHHPPLAVMYLADVDHQGHLGNFSNYVRAIAVADSIVGELWDFLQNDPAFAGRTTLLVTNDHGRHDDSHGGFSGHGDGCWGCRRIILLGVGPAVRSGVLTTVRRRIPDIVPTIGAILEFPTPQSSGTVMEEVLAPASSVADGESLPVDLWLDQNFPNPFNPATTITYRVPLITGQPAALSGATEPMVTLKVYDVLGREVETLVNGVQPAGTHQVTWNAASRAAGIYLCRLTAGEVSVTRKLILLK